MQSTSSHEWRAQSTGNRQGSGPNCSAEQGAHLSQRESELQELSRTVYEERLVAGVAREQARKDLPLSTYTEAYWKVDLHNLLHFLSLRMDSHAQYEIRQYATLSGNEVTARWCPVAWEAFVDYRLKAKVLSHLDQAVIRSLIAEDDVEACRLAESFGWLARAEGKLKQNRERNECEDKLRDMGLDIPWH